MKVTLPTMFALIALFCPLFSVPAGADDPNSGWHKVGALQINCGVNGDSDMCYIRIWLSGGDISGYWDYQSRNTGRVALIESLALTAMSTAREVKIYLNDPDQTGPNRGIGSIVIR